MTHNLDLQAQCWDSSPDVHPSPPAAKWPVTPVRELQRQSRDVGEAQELYKFALGHSQSYPEYDGYPVWNFSIPVDHFHNSSAYEPHSNASFDNQYYLEKSYYKPGGPVILLLAGETWSGSRIPFAQKGILAKLAKATNGMGVILEHRYYGESWPTEDLSTHNLRFLTTEQALLDAVFFAENIVFPGYEDVDLTSKAVPWIAYGGSYAGAFAAFLRTLYPGVFWGAISSSGVTAAVYDYWQYWEPIRQYGPEKCIRTTESIIGAIDTILMEKIEMIPRLKSVFGMETLSDHQDFANILTYSGVGGWQSRNWDPEVSSPAFDDYCSNLNSDELLYPQLAERASEVAELLESAAALNPSGSNTNLTLALLNWIGRINETMIHPCFSGRKETNETTLDTCYSTLNETFYAQDDISQAWRAWPYQYCTVSPVHPCQTPQHQQHELTSLLRQQWGYLQTGSGAPSHLPPLISRTIDLNYMSRICAAAFNITSPPDVESINKYGSFNVSYPRLAHIAGQADPWTPATPWKSELKQWEWRKNDTSEPFVLIEGAVHHWDENGLYAGEKQHVPEAVRAVQEWEVEFVRAWLEEAKSSGKFVGMKEQVHQDGGQKPLGL